MRRALFLDRDCTINREVDYLSAPDQLELIGDVADAIAQARQQGIAIVVITNQSGIARGMLTEADLTAIHARLDAMLLARNAGAIIDAYYACQHHPDYGGAEYQRDCDCRKPKPGLLIAAARDLHLDLSDSAMIGDSVRDLDAARAVGVPKRYLVATGKGSAQREQLAADDRYVADAAAAVQDWLGA